MIIKLKKNREVQTTDNSIKYTNNRNKLSAKNYFNYDKDFEQIFKRKAIQGVGWNIGGKVAIQFIRFCILFILARKLLPQDFGLMGMVIAVTAFVDMFRGEWMGAALIQRKKLNDLQLSSVFWITCVLGLILTGIIIICSHWVSAFFKSPKITLILVVLSWTILFGALAIVPYALFSRRLEFHKLYFVDISVVVISGIFGIALAYSGFGVWSLIVKIFVESLMRAGLFWIIIKWRPRFEFSFNTVREILVIALPLLGFVLVNYFASNMDYIIIGKFLGPVALGFYTLGYKIMLLPIENISSAMAKVALPSFSSMQENKARIGHLYLKMIKYISFMTFPSMAGLAILAPEIIKIGFGEKWFPVVYIIRILAIVGAIASIQATTGVIFISQGRSDLEFKWSLFGTFCYIIGFLSGLRWGIQGVALGYAIAFVCTAPICFFIALRLIRLKLSDLGLALVPAVIGSAFMISVILLVRFSKVLEILNPSITLIIVIVLGFTLYGLFNLSFRKDFVIELINMLKEAILPTNSHRAHQY